jgi:hypothetical protein
MISNVRSLLSQLSDIATLAHELMRLLMCQSPTRNLPTLSFRVQIALVIVTDIMSHETKKASSIAFRFVTSMFD